jgi:hypothetical protein
MTDQTLDIIFSHFCKSIVTGEKIDETNVHLVAEDIEKAINNPEIEIEHNEQKEYPKYTCECGRILLKADKWKHLRSKIHMNYINGIEKNYVVCECGGQFDPKSKYKHVKGKKHLNFINKQN